ncbi:MAG: transketolase [Deltaproteobacteria bacterium]|nr:transketolase [Candidatus Anaeroferrophillacea bacterium]
MVTTDERQTLEQRCINTIRMLAVDGVERAQSGHPGMPMGAAAMASVLWQDFLRHHPANPAWLDRDRFVLSAGHGSMLLYALLHLTGYDVSLDDLKNFRQWGSCTPGHPEYGHTPGVETTTGPLGQGFATGVGMAIAAAHKAARFNRPGYNLVDHYIYAIVGDGDLMEGVSQEAASLAGTLKLGRLIYLYDDNHISIEGSTDLAFTEDRAARFRACGWQVLEVSDGNDTAAVAAAIAVARNDERPSLIALRTRIGFGSPHKQDCASAHGEPLGADEVRLTRECLGWPADRDFVVPDDVAAQFLRARERGAAAEREWDDKLAAYRRDHPDLAREWDELHDPDAVSRIAEELPVFPPDEKGMATRAASGKVLNALAPRLAGLMGGSADLAPSNKTLIDGEADFSAADYTGRNLRFGVREHAMAAALNGMALHGGLIPYGGTFLVFSDYMKPAIRLAAMMGLRVIYVFTHDSIGLGEDGPTHQPVEHLAALRAVPNLRVFRPADANETAAAWKAAMERAAGPTAMALTRQNVPTIDINLEALRAGVARGGYVIADGDGDGDPEVILIGTGSEVAIVLEAARLLAADGVRTRVVSMPCRELFAAQERGYRDAVLPPAVTCRVAVEAGATMGWERFTGSGGAVVGIDRFGASAPYQELYRRFGFTPAAVAERARGLLRTN